MHLPDSVDSPGTNGDWPWKGWASAVQFRPWPPDS